MGCADPQLNAGGVVYLAVRGCTDLLPRCVVLPQLGPCVRPAGKSTAHVLVCGRHGERNAVAGAWYHRAGCKINADTYHLQTRRSAVAGCCCCCFCHRGRHHFGSTFKPISRVLEGEAWRWKRQRELFQSFSHRRRIYICRGEGRKMNEEEKSTCVTANYIGGSTRAHHTRYFICTPHVVA